MVTQDEQSPDHALTALLEEIRDNQRIQLEHQSVSMEVQKEQFRLAQEQFNRATELQDRAEAMQNKGNDLVAKISKVMMILLPAVFILILYLGWVLFKWL